MVQRGGTVRMNVQNVTLLVCVATLVMVACVLFKTCVNEGFQGSGTRNDGGKRGNQGGSHSSAAGGPGSNNHNNHSNNGGSGGFGTGQGGGQN